MKTIKMIVLGLVFALLVISPVIAKTGKGFLYNDGNIVRTVVNPARLPHGGTDPIYAVTNGVEGQLGIAGLVPGDAGYSGGDWAVYLVSFNEGIEPYLLTSDEAVFEAEELGDVTVTRNQELDFRCPVQP